MNKFAMTSAAAIALASAPALAQDAMSELDDPIAGMDGAEVEIEISNVEEDAGKVYVALQTEEEFATNEAAYTEIVEADDDEVEVEFDDVEPGTYAVAVFQDTDGNGKLTTEGKRPSEPYGFSGEGSESSQPQFVQSSMTIADEAEAEIELKRGNEGTMKKSGE